MANYTKYSDFQDGNILYAKGLHYLEDYLEKCLNIVDTGISVTGDLNNYKDPGVYSISAGSNALNLPKVDLPVGEPIVLTRGGKMIVLMHYNKTRRLQIISEAGTDNKIFYRVFEELSTAPGTGSWQPWQLIVRNLGDLGITASLEDLNNISKNISEIDADISKMDTNISKIDANIKDIQAIINGFFDGNAAVAVANRVKGRLYVGKKEENSENYYDGSEDFIITAADLGLGNAVRFVGVKETLPKTGADGDIVLCNGIEYIYSNGKWEPIGDEAIHALVRQTGTTTDQYRPLTLGTSYSTDTTKLDDENTGELYVNEKLYV